MYRHGLMNSSITNGNAIRIASMGHVAFAVVMIGLGVLGLVKGDFTVIWQPIQRFVPAREVLVYLCALVSLGSGIGLLWRRTAALAAGVLLALFVVWILVWRLRVLFLAPFVQSTWSLGQTLVMTAAAWILFAWFATDSEQRFGFVASDTGVRVARVLYALGLIPFGIAHFMYVKETTVLIPGWLPWPTAWAYFTGATFIAASLAILTGVFARLGAALSALQMGLFFLLVWIPRIAAGSLSAFQWGEVVTTLALTAAGWVVADSYRDSHRKTQKV